VPISLWRSVLHSLDVAVCAVDRDLRVTLANPAWDTLVQTLGRAELRGDRLIGRVLLDVMSPEEHERCGGICRRLLAGKEPASWTTLCWPVGETQIWTSLAARAVIGANGEIDGISFTLTDITGHKQLESDAVKRRIELRVLYEVAQSIGTIDDTAELCQRVTAHLGSLFGARICAIAMRDEDTGQVLTRLPAYGLQNDEASDFALPRSLLEAVDASLHEPSSSSYLFRDHLLDAGGDCQEFSQRWGVASLFVAPLRNQGRVLGFLILADKTSGFDTDTGHLLATFAGIVSAAMDASLLVSALKNRAAGLSAALAEIEQLGRLKDEVVQNVSHELRLPLMVIQGYADLGKMGAFGTLSPEIQRAMDVIGEKATLLGKRVGDIVLLRGLRTADLRLGPVSLAGLAHEAIERARARAALNHVVLVDEIVPESTPLLADRQRIEQVIDQLIDNAIKFSPDGGEVKVTVREGAEVEYLKVSDEGIGVPASQVDRIWDRFYQYDGSTTRRFGGTGVGLAVVKQIVVAHGGQAWVESREGQGSHFYVALPRSNSVVANQAVE
jgi:PAS domain S-box-containing protein